jgi:hypothetical protein
VRPLARATARLLLPVLLCAALPAQAAPPADMPWLHDIFVTLREANDAMTAHVSTALTSAGIGMVVHVLFASLSLFLFVWKFIGFALRGFDLVDLLELMFTMGFVYLLLTGYRGLMPAIAAATRFVGDHLGGSIAGIGTDRTLAEEIFTTVLQLSLHPVCDGLMDCITNRAYAIFTTMVASLAILFLGAIATVVELWMQWCFEIAFGVGWFTIPFLLFRRLSFLFDGWLKLFFNVMMYDLIAKVTLSMVLLGFRSMSAAATGSMGATIDVHGPYDLIALFLFLVLGMLAMACTGRFATSVVAGMSGTGGLLQDVARSAARSAGGR